MARIGQFAGASEEYGVPVSFVHPVDNDFERGRFTDTVIDPRLKMTKQQRRELQTEIDQFLSVLRSARDA